jgi:hypothetical protein
MKYFHFVYKIQINFQYIWPISGVFGTFLMKGNSSDLFLSSLASPNQNEAASAHIFPPYVKMWKKFKNVRVSVLSVRASVSLIHSTCRASGSKKICTPLMLHVDISMEKRVNNNSVPALASCTALEIALLDTVLFL